MKYALIVVFVLIVIILVFLILKILPLLTAKPTIKVNYLAEYNKVTKPANYDPNLNAAPLLQKAFGNYVEMPESIRQKKGLSPADLNSQEIITLRNWLDSNVDFFQYLNKAAKKPYYWLERHSEDNSMTLEYPEFSNLVKLARAFEWRILLQAFDGEFTKSFEDVFTFYTIGTFFAGPRNLVEQMIGFSLRALSIEIAFNVLGRSENNMSNLKLLQQRIQTVLLEHECKIHYSKGEMLFVLDAIQRTFTDDGKGNGKLIPSAYAQITKGSVDLDGTSLAISYPKALMISLTHPGRKETTELAKQLFEELNILWKLLPWQLHKKGTGCVDQIDSITKGNFVLNHGMSSTGLIFEYEHRHKATADALITTVAILRYKADNGELPQQLEGLISAGYIKELPMDPFSSKSLVYQKTGDSFMLYTVGGNFKDDGGSHTENWEGDHVFWPVQARGKSQLKKAPN